MSDDWSARIVDLRDNRRSRIVLADGTFGEGRQSRQTLGSFVDGRLVEPRTDPADVAELLGDELPPA